MADQNDQQTDVTGLALTRSLKHLLYFNGRFMTAQDMMAEQQTFLSRHQLAQRALGPGVSYGLYVSADKDKNNLLISAGHASDGIGQDLWLNADSQGQAISDLVAKYEKRPLTADLIGPALTPRVIPVAAARFDGLFLLTATRYQKNGPPVEELGSQCADSSKQCRAGSFEEGINLELVHVEAPDNVATDRWIDIDWIGWGARAYFQKERVQYPTQLNRMTVRVTANGPTPLAAALQPGRESHVPIAALYLKSRRLMAYDVWTARRQRTPTESAQWLNALLQPFPPGQLARVLQFQNQLTLGLATSPVVKPTSLWGLGFSPANANNALVLPGCGFLPVNPTDLRTQIEQYLSTSDGNRGVPFELRQVTQGEMNAIFSSSLAANELWLESASKQNWNQPQTPRQITIWSANLKPDTHPPGGYAGYVMFTWPMNQDIIARIPADPIVQEYHLCIQTEGNTPQLDDGSKPKLDPQGKPLFNILKMEGPDREWIGAPDQDERRPLTLGTLPDSGVIYTAKVDGVRIKHSRPANDGKPHALAVTVTTNDVTVSLATDDKGVLVSTATQICDKVLLAAKDLLSAKATGKGSGIIPGATLDAEGKEAFVPLLGNIYSVLSRFRAAANPTRTSLKLLYATAVLKNGVWVAGDWTKATDMWCPGMDELDPIFGINRTFIRGVAFGLEGAAAQDYVVRYRVQGKLVDPSGASVIHTSSPVNSDDTPNAPTLCSVFLPSDVDRKNPLPVHKIQVQILPRCGLWPES